MSKNNPSKLIRVFLPWEKELKKQLEKKVAKKNAPLYSLLIFDLDIDRKELKKQLEKKVGKTNVKK